MNAYDLLNQQYEASVRLTDEKRLRFLEGAEKAEARVQELDELEYKDAIRLVFAYGKPSTQLLQRRLGIGYGKASALIERMRADGLLSPQAQS